MSVVSLLTLSASLLQREPGPPNEYGDPSWTETATAVSCELQQESATEALGGTVEVTLWRLFLPPEAPLRGWDAVAVSGDTFELEGDAWLARNPRTGLPSHVEARVRRVE